MFFIALVLFAALFIEGIGTYISVAGLGHLFNMNPVIILMAIALDIGKVAGVSFLYKYWKDIKLLMKGFMIPATAVLMLITSTGVFGYLSQQFQHAIVTNNQDTIIITSLEGEQTKLQARKQEIDKQIANLPADYARARRQLMQEFAPETDRINKRLVEIDVQLPQLKSANVKQSADLGPILYVAEAFNTTPEKAVKYVILTIIFVFDPFAIVLLIAGNFLIERRKKPEPAAPVMVVGEVTGPLMTTTTGTTDEYYKEQVEKAADPDAVLKSSFDADELSAGMDTLAAYSPDSDKDIFFGPHPGGATVEVPDDMPLDTPAPVVEEYTASTSRPALPEEKGEDAERDVITLPQLQTPRSSLEHIDARRADVVMSLNSIEAPPAITTRYTER